MWDALSCRADRPGSISTTGSGSSGELTRTTPRASPSEWAASVDMTNVLMPWRAACTAVAAAVVVLPTPPLPVKRMTLTRCPGSGSGLDPLLECLQRSVDDDPLGLALQHAQHGNLDVHRQSIGDERVGAAGLKGVGPVQRLEHQRADQGPRDHPRAVLGHVPVVLQDVGVLDGASVQRELDLVSPSVTVLGEHRDLPDLACPFGIAVEIGNDVEDRTRCGVDDGAGLSAIGHAAKATLASLTSRLDACGRLRTYSSPQAAL